MESHKSDHVPHIHTLYSHVLFILLLLQITNTIICDSSIVERALLLDQLGDLGGDTFANLYMQIKPMNNKKKN